QEEFRGIEPSSSSSFSQEEFGEIYLETNTGLKIELITEFPAQKYLSQFTLALTTVGANTAQLGALTVPMLVLLPTQNLEAMQSWDGLPGMLARSPILGNYFAKLINGIILSKKRLYAWPNIWAGREIVPELIGYLDAKTVAKKVISLLDDPEQLAEIKDQLRQVRGKPGAAKAIADLVIEQIK
ncbi:MAG: lipid-A-disaccharide synthase, partial [Microcystaceae cyanobacterium]